MPARSLMVLGTASHVGKSLLTAALCRIFAQRGYRVAPFKAQNMSLNSAATVEGLEIGRAQALQAEAAGIPASVHMNPILIKPTGLRSSQIIVHGKVWKHLTAADYHKSRVAELVPVIRHSYELLAAENELIVLEGAGSPAEINLRASDIVNMRMAAIAEAACILVGDIDRGGVFAAILGTLELLEPEERKRIRGFVINKFRGDVDLLVPGIRMLEHRIGIPCVGVVPYLKELTLEEEDSAGFSHASPTAWSANQADDRPLRVAVIAFPWISNFTDFDPLAAEASVEVRFCRTTRDADGADVIVLPGTKQTTDDLNWLRETGFEPFLHRHAAHGVTVGICGGMQMLGEEIHDPYGIETEGSVKGLGLLPIRTTMQRNKVTHIASGEVASAGLLEAWGVAEIPIRGYEIHLGETEYLMGAEPFSRIVRHAFSSADIEDGCVGSDGRTFGTYLHGLFDHDAFRHAFISAVRSYLGLAPATQFAFREQEREAQWKLLTDATAKALDLDRITAWLGLPAPQSAYEAAL